jgi:phage terminase large subunit-like protein
MDAWNACDENLTAAALDGRHEELRGSICYGGLDLSTKLDITALALWFPETNDLLLRFYCPEETVMERSSKDRVPYDAWVRDGWMTATPGNVIDYDYVKADMIALADRFQVVEWAFDPWNATQIAVQCQGEGLPMVEVRQGYKSLSEPCKEFEKLVISGLVRHGGNPVMREMVSNVSLREDPNGNIAPNKSTSTGRIDGIPAVANALSRAIIAPSHSSVYETRGLLTL